MKWKTPNFNNTKLIRTLQIYDFLENKYQMWAECLNKLGIEAGVAVTYWPMGLYSDYVPENTQTDLLFLTALFEARTLVELPALKLRLDIPLQNLKHQLDIQSPVV